MRLIRKQLERDGSGVLTIVPQDNEDIWYLYNIVQEGDEVTAITSRKLANEKGAPRVKLTLQIKVAKIDYDAGAGTLRLNGRTTNDHEDVPLNSFHTLQLEPQLKCDIYKDEWDSFAINQLEEACDIANRSDIAAIVLQPGLAHICLVTDAMTVIRQKIEVTIPKKRRGDNSGMEKAVQKFYKQIYSAIPKVINLEKIKAVLIAGPGSGPRELFNTIMQLAMSEENQPVLQARQKFLVAHASSGHMHSLHEALQDKQIQESLANTRYGRETRVMDKFFKSLNDDDLKAWYGPDEVEKAVDLQAVETLMLTDSLFRSSELRERKRYVALYDAVRDLGKEVLIFSSLHQSGEQLDSVSGVACLLMYPLDLDEQSDQENEN